MLPKLFVWSAMIVMGVLAGIGFLVLKPRLADSFSQLRQQTSVSQTQTSTTIPTAGTPSSIPPNSLIEEWSQFCVKQISYVLVAAPEGATLSAVNGAPPAAETSSTTVNAEEVSCQSLGAMDGRQLILCRGPMLKTITLSLTSGGQTQEKPIIPAACAQVTPTALPLNPGPGVSTKSPEGIVPTSSAATPLPTDLASPPPGPTPTP